MEGRFLLKRSRSGLCFKLLWVCVFLVSAALIFVLNMKPLETSKHETRRKLFIENSYFDTDGYSTFLQEKNEILNQFYEKGLKDFEKKERRIGDIKDSRSSFKEIKSMTDILVKLESKVDDIASKLKQKIKNNPVKARVINLPDVKKCNQPRVLFLVTSHSSNFGRRKSIRENWGNQDKFKIFKNNFKLTYDVYFSVGLGVNFEESEKVKKESKQHRDILIINRHEDFYDLTRRLMAGFEWVVNNCEFTYLFKVDDDIFVNIPNVFAFLANDTINETRLYAGDMNVEALVNRNPKSKYSVSYEEWPLEYYPPYCSGGGFIMSRDIIKSIIPYFDWTNPYKIDDVYVGILIERTKMPDIQYYVPESDYLFWFYGNSTLCRYRKTSLILHKVDTDSCMISLTSKSIRFIQPILKELNRLINRPPPSLEELASRVSLPEKFQKNKHKDDKFSGKIPRIEDLPKALSPSQTKKKQIEEYLERHRKRLIGDN